MAFDVSALSNYTDEQSHEYLRTTIAKGKSLELFTNIQTGIKTSSKIKIFDSTGVWQSNSTCAFNASGGDVFSDRTITVGGIKVNKEWCPKVLEAKYTQLELKKGSKYEDLGAFQSDITDLLGDKDAYNMEICFWNGDTDSGDAYLSKFDGLRKIIGAASGVLATATSGTTTWSSANSRTVMGEFATKVATSLPQFLSDPDVVLVMGDKELMDLTQKYITDDDFNTSWKDGIRYVEGTNIPIVPLLGLSGKGEMYLLKKDNVVKGVDMEGEEDKIEMWYSQDDRMVRYSKEWKFGVQIVHPSEVIKFITA